MSKKHLAVILIFGALFAGVVVNGCFFWKNDTFDRCQLRLSSPQKTYAVGDTIILNFDIVKAGNCRVRLYEDRSKSLNISVMRMEGERPDPTDLTAAHRLPKASKDDVIEVIEFPPSGVFRVVIEGVVNRSEDGYVFNLGNFGKFKKNKLGIFALSGTWFPINPFLGDSFEYFTNDIRIEIYDEDELKNEGSSDSSDSAR